MIVKFVKTVSIICLILLIGGCVVLDIAAQLGFRWGL